MTVIRQEDFIATVHGALQYISYYHPVDYITDLASAYEREQSPAARMRWRRSSSTPACARKAIAPFARTLAL